MLTEKQIARNQKKIQKLKQALAADKKYWGGAYHDGRGIRYSLPCLYIQMQDYSGGLRYLNWFQKNFPDDIANPVFLFEWTIITFKKGKLAEAAQKARLSYAEHPYIFDDFLGRPLPYVPKSSHESLEDSDSLRTDFPYSHADVEILDFVGWLEKFLASKPFLDFANELIPIRQQIETGQRGLERDELFAKERSLLEGKSFS